MLIIEIVGNYSSCRISPLTQKIKAPQHLLRLKDEEDGCDDEWDGRFRLPSLPRQKALKDNDTLSNSNSAATSVSWSQEVESVATQKLEEQWTVVERTLYEEDTQMLKDSILSECTQWKTQIPYLRIVGKNPTCDSNSTQRDIGSSSKKTKRLDDLQNDEVFIERNLSMKVKKEFLSYVVIDYTILYILICKKYLYYLYYRKERILCNTN